MGVHEHDRVVCALSLRADGAKSALRGRRSLRDVCWASRGATDGRRWDSLLSIARSHAVWGWQVRYTCREVTAPRAVGFAGCLRKGAVGEEGFTGDFGEEELAGSEEVVDGVALLEGDEEELAGAGAPTGEEVGGGEEDVWGVGEGGAEEHGG